MPLHLMALLYSSERVIVNQITPTGTELSLYAVIFFCKKNPLSPIFGAQTFNLNTIL